MSAIDLLPCGACRSASIFESELLPRDGVLRFVRCTYCGLCGPRSHSSASAIQGWNTLMKRAEAGRMLGEAAAEVNAREGVTAERFVTLRGRATS